MTSDCRVVDAGKFLCSIAFFGASCLRPAEFDNRVVYYYIHVRVKDLAFINCRSPPHQSPVYADAIWPNLATAGIPPSDKCLVTVNTMVVATVEFQLGGEPPSGLVKSLKREKDEKVREVGGDVEATGLNRPGSIIVPYVHKLV